MGYITICFLITNAFLIASPIDNTRCPVEPTEIAVSKYQTNYKDKTIYFCCKDCVSIFKENPKPYLTALDDLAKV
ncbi:MAG: YHS domain-containing protein, partial [Verrucomicrobiota bacterium]|nr:YHS domain-containing protein [Verrucomicrobiota bacterium]